MVSQPCGVWKFHAPRRVTAPAGVPMSSCEMNMPGIKWAISRVCGVSWMCILISRLVAPIPPIGSRYVTVKIGSHLVPLVFTE